MYRYTVRDLPAHVRSDEEVRDWLGEEPDAWREALDLEVWQLDPRNNYVHHEVLQIDVQDGRISVQYDVDFYAYFGCRDIDGSGQDQREIRGRVDNGRVVFETYVQPDQLAPDEEL